MKTLISKWYWLFFLILIFIPLKYSFHKGIDINYWDGAIGNWLATMAGIIGGIPIALEINRLIIRTTERKKLIEEKAKEKDLLLLLKEELHFNKDRLEKRNNNQGDLPLYPFKSDLWDAVSDSGEIRFIKNSGLLNRIASVYYIIKTVKKIEEQCYVASRSATVTFGNNVTAVQLLLTDARRFDVQNMANIQSAIRFINHELRTYED